MQRSKINSIQGLRAIAILMIFVSHTAVFLTTNVKMLQITPYWGCYEVNIFICISAVLIYLNGNKNNWRGTIKEGVDYSKRN